MNDAHCIACEEYTRLSRRGFLAGAGAGALAFSVPAWLPRVAMASSHRSAAQDVIVQVYLRGGCDGLSMVVPWNEPNYVAARPQLAVGGPLAGGTNNVIDLGSTAASATAPGGQVVFGLHPAMSGLMEAYDNNHLLFVQAAGLTNTNKSHFDAQKFMEVARVNDPTATTGWLGRHLALVDPMSGTAMLRAIGIADGLQRTLAGAPLALPVPNMQNDPGAPPLLNNFTSYGLVGTTASRPTRTSAISTMYGAQADPVRSAAVNTLSTITLLNNIGAAGYAPAGGAVYPSTSLGRALRSTAALINAQVGVEAVAIDTSGWDTHAQQGGATGIVAGTSMFTVMQGLGSSLGAFYRDVMATRQRNVTLVVISEFGRRVGQNGTLGTDHGYGNMMFVMGRSINGGRVLTNWPGISPNQPATSVDLGVTIDYRDVLAEIVQGRLGNGQLDLVFPGYTPTFRGVLA